MKHTTSLTIVAAILAAASLGLTAATAAPARQGPAATAAQTPRELAFHRGGWIHVVREDGTGLRRLTRGHSPAWSPDGRRIMFVQNDRFYVVEADGTGRRALTRAGGGFAPAWSPDGRRFAFASRRTGHTEIYVASADGTKVRRVTTARRRDEAAHGPAWSPDGALLAFSSDRPSMFNSEIYVARPDGTGLRRLTRTHGADALLGDDGMPHWSPDGRRIVFTSNRTQDGAIWIMNRDGSGQRQLFGIRGTDEWRPRFSPDGARIAFVRLFADGTEDVWLMNSNGKAARKLTSGGDPAWRPGAE
jgi:Tol biopolymer transport system component